MEEIRQLLFVFVISFVSFSSDNAYGTISDEGYDSRLKLTNFSNREGEREHKHRVHDWVNLWACLCVSTFSLLALKNPREMIERARKWEAQPNNYWQCARYVTAQSLQMCSLPISFSSPTLPFVFFFSFQKCSNIVSVFCGCVILCVALTLSFNKVFFHTRLVCFLHR